MTSTKEEKQALHGKVKTLEEEVHEHKQEAAHQKERVRLVRAEVRRTPLPLSFPNTQTHTDTHRDADTDTHSLSPSRYVIFLCVSVLRVLLCVGLLACPLAAPPELHRPLLCGVSTKRSAEKRHGAGR